MASLENECDPDTEYVPDYDMIDLNDYQLTKGDELAGGSWEIVVDHCREEDASLQFALPPFVVGENGIDIQITSKNGFCRVAIDNDNQKHVEFKNWIQQLETWIVNQIVSNHQAWFGHMWAPGGALQGRARPTDAVIKSMYHPMVDEENIFCSRVHLRKNSYEIQCMDSEQNMIELDSIKNCLVVPLVELKSIFMKPKGYNPDIVLRGLVAIRPEETLTNNTEYTLFHAPDDEDTFGYADYATEDEDDTEDEDESLEVQNTQQEIEVETNDVEQNQEKEIILPETTTSSTYDKETLESLMRATEDAKNAAKNAEDVYKKYQQYMASQSSS